MRAVQHGRPLMIPTAALGLARQLWIARRVVFAGRMTAPA